MISINIEQGTIAGRLCPVNISVDITDVRVRVAEDERGLELDLVVKNETSEAQCVYLNRKIPERWNMHLLDLNNNRLYPLYYTYSDDARLRGMYLEPNEVLELRAILFYKEGKLILNPSVYEVDPGEIYSLVFFCPTAEGTAAVGITERLSALLELDDNSIYQDGPDAPGR